MAFFLNKNLVFIDSMQFLNSSLDKLVKNLSDEDFKYLVEEFGSKNVRLLKQKFECNLSAKILSIFMSTWTVSKDLKKKIAC